MLQIQEIVLHVDLKTMSFNASAPKIGKDMPFDPYFVDSGNDAPLLQQLCEKMFFAYANPDPATSQSRINLKFDENGQLVIDPDWKTPAIAPKV